MESRYTILQCAIRKHGYLRADVFEQPGALCFALLYQMVAHSRFYCLSFLLRNAGWMLRRLPRLDRGRHYNDFHRRET